MNRRKKGFTLIELMVVIVIIGILGTLVVGAFFGEDEKARAKVATANVRTIYNAIERYKLSNPDGEYPETLQELLTGPADYEGNWKPLLQGGSSALKDPWDFEYAMSEDADGRIIVICYGSDGEEGPGTKEFDADIQYPPLEEE